MGNMAFPTRYISVPVGPLHAEAMLNQSHTFQRANGILHLCQPIHLNLSITQDAVTLDRQ